MTFESRSEGVGLGDALCRGDTQRKGPERAGVLKEQPGGRGGQSRVRERQNQGCWAQGFACALSGMGAQRPPCHTHTASQTHTHTATATQTQLSITTQPEGKSRPHTITHIQTQLHHTQTQLIHSRTGSHGLENISLKHHCIRPH